MTPLGSFNFEASYWSEAEKIRRCKHRSTDPHSPVLFLYFHAIELYLKAFLRAVGLGEKSLRKIGHQFSKLAERASEAGLSFDEEDVNVINYITGETWEGSRYLI